jgi:hypothetical protein
MELMPMSERGTFPERSRIPLLAMKVKMTDDLGVEGKIMTVAAVTRKQIVVGNAFEQLVAAGSLCLLPP